MKLLMENWRQYLDESEDAAERMAAKFAALEKRSEERAQQREAEIQQIRGQRAKLAAEIEALEARSVERKNTWKELIAQRQQEEATQAAEQAKQAEADRQQREEFQQRLAQGEEQRRVDAERAEREAEVFHKVSQILIQLPQRVRRGDSLEDLRAELEDAGATAEKIELVLRNVSKMQAMQRRAGEAREEFQAAGSDSAGCGPGSRFNAMTGEKCPDETAGCRKSGGGFNSITGKPCK
jgi:hypothetical protein